MRYFELFERASDQLEQDASAQKPKQPSFDHYKVYYHVTTKQRVKSIQENGIETNRHRRWKSRVGRTIGDRGCIYLISDFKSAVHFAQKQEWEHFGGRVPDKPAYVIICVRDDPKNLEQDPHPDNSLYGNSWFQKKGNIPPADILKVIPVTKSLIKQYLGALTEESLAGLSSNYSHAKCVRALETKGWHETSTPNMFQNSEYPEFSIDLDINSARGAPFDVFFHNKLIDSTRVVPYAQNLALKFNLTDKPLSPKPETDHQNWWDHD